MTYEHDPEFPFSKIVVKNDLSAVGTIRRNLITGNYHFYESESAFTASCIEQRIDSMKVKIEELLQSRARQNQSLDSSAPVPAESW